MCSVPDTTRSDGYCQTSGEAGDIAASFTGKDYYQNLIDCANTVPIVRIFRHYGLRIDEYNRKITCPFKHHKGGHENTPSFYYYPQTNSFRCYGCGIGHQNAHGCEFVAAMDGISRVKAAAKILDLFAADVDEEVVINQREFSERLEIMMDFSNTVREFRQTYTDEKSQKFIEDMCWVYDQHNLKHDHTNKALRRVVEQIKEKIVSYICRM
jgi:DNA primase